MSRIRPVILAGGPGARLWPASDAEHPKPFLKLDGERTLIGHTLDRLNAPDIFLAPIITCAVGMADMSREALRAAGVTEPSLILEPAPRDTAAAIAAIVAARQAVAPDELLLILPADHMIDDVAAFQAACARGADVASGGRLVLFGVTPTSPHTGYGYVEATAAGDIADVISFHEKPDLPTAEAFLATGSHMWNAGMFLAPVATFAAAFTEHAPEIFNVARSAVDKGRHEGDALVLEPDVFKTAPKAAFDRAVVEKLSNLAVVRLSCGWSDVGAWDAVFDMLAKDANGDAAIGDVALLDTHGVLASTTGPRVAVMGLTDVVVVASPHGVLVCSREHAQRVKELLERFSGS